MPDLIAIAERLAEHPPVAVLDGTRCLRVRDRESTCAACAEACPVGTIAVRAATAEEVAPYGSVDAVRDAGPRIDDETCVRCGACVATCPTNALLALPPLDDKGLFAQVEAAGTAARERAVAEAVSIAASGAGGDGPSCLGPPTASTPMMPADAPGDSGNEIATSIEPPTAGFACERLAQTLRLDGERVVVLPCLAWVDVALLVHLACNGAERIAVPLDACPSCELARTAELVRAAVNDARRICAATGIDAAFETTDGAGLRDLEAAPEADAAGELSRRSLFTQAGASLLDTARAETTRQLESLASAPVGYDAPIESDTRRWQLLDDLHAAGLSDDAAVVPRALAPRVSIDVERCSGCAQCALFCPTEALRRIGRAPGGRTLLEFDPARCRDCGVCEATCRYAALTCEETLTVAELFALDPQAILIPKRRVLPERRSNA